MNMALCDRPSGPKARTDIRLEGQQDNLLTMRMWGSRGSIPVSGSQFALFGGNTTCIEIRCGDDLLLFDAGSGIVPAGMALMAEGATNVNVFLSHSHYDHMIGLPYLKCLYNPAAKVTIHSGHMAGEMTTEQIVDEFMRPPFFPIRPSTCRARLDFGDFAAGDVLKPFEGVSLKTGLLNHPGGAIGYRLEWAGRSVAIITDTEHEPGALDPEVLSLIADVDLFFYDACYTDEEMEKFKGFGHSSWQQAVKLAKAANAKSVGLMHHAPWRTDDELLALEQKAAAEFHGAFAARDGQILTLRGL